MDVSIWGFGQSATDRAAAANFHYNYNTRGRRNMLLHRDQLFFFFFFWRAFNFQYGGGFVAALSLRESSSLADSGTTSKMTTGNSGDWPRKVEKKSQKPR